MRLLLILHFALVATTTAASTPTLSASVDVAIVGAGYAGLVVARRLSQSAPHLKVALLEALDGPGGRARDHTFQTGHVVEHGVAFIGDAHEMPFAQRLIVEELGMQTYKFPVWGPGNCTDSKGWRKCSTALLCKDMQGHITPFKTLFPGILTSKCVGSSVAIVEILAATAELMRMTKNLDCTAPWDHPKAQEWDRETFGTWLRRWLPTPAAYNYMKLTVEPDISQDVDTISLLHAVFLAKTGGGVFDGLFGFNNGFRIVGGGAAPAFKMADDLVSQPKMENTTIRFAALVRRIAQNQSHAVLTVDLDSESPSKATVTEITARHVVLTGSPSVVGRIEFDPPLPFLKRQLASSMPMGNAVRMMAVYDKGPFWRRAGLSGSHGDEDPSTLFSLGYDMTPCDQHADQPLANVSVPTDCATAPGVLQVETTGRASDILMSMTPKERFANFTEYMSQFYGPEARSASELLAFDFNTQPTLGGGSQAHFPPGLWTQAGRALRDPFGRILFAGTEYAAVGFGYVNGAISSAEETAKILLNVTARLL